MKNKFYILSFICLVFLPAILPAQDYNMVNSAIYSRESSKYRWFRCSELLYDYAMLSNRNSGKIKDIINILTSDEDRVNQILKDYWKTYWAGKSQESLTLSQQELAKNNQHRANQLNFDAKFAQRIADNVDDKKVPNTIIQFILQGDLLLQGNAMDFPKEEVFQGFRKYYTKEYDKVYDKLWKPQDENIPEAYTLPPYLFSHYKLLGPSSDLIHTYSINTYHYFDIGISLLPFSTILSGEEFDKYKSGYGLSIKSSFNFTFGEPIENRQFLLLSHNSFKDVLDLNDRKDITGLFYRSQFYWDLCWNLGFITYPSKSSDTYLNNFFTSLGFGGNYRFNPDFLMTLNFYYLGFNYQADSDFLSSSGGNWYYFVAPELEAEFNLWIFTLRPMVKYTYQFKAENTKTTLDFGLGFKILLSQGNKIEF
jgi:hypothetical protein